MSGLEMDTIGGFNGFVERQARAEGETLVTAVLFDNRYEILWQRLDAHLVHLTEKEYYVRGSTALLDAVGKTILDVGRRLSNTVESERPSKVIVVIVTDGLENASREFTYEKVKELITNQQERYNGEFIFLGANIDVVEEANRIGIEVKDAYCFEATKTGVDRTYSIVNEAVTDKRRTRRKNN